MAPWILRDAHARGMWYWRTALTGLALALLSPVLLPLLVRAQPPVATVEVPPSPEERSALNQVLFRNRQLNTFLVLAQRKLSERRITDALAALQRVFDHPEDGFIWVEDATGPQSTRVLASQMLRSAPSSVMQTYEDVYGRAAQAQLQTAIASQDPAEFTAIVRRYFHTAAGASALDWLAARHLEQGEFELAALAWERLLDEPVHARRLTPSSRLKAALALSRSGRKDRATVVAAPLAGTSLKIAGRNVKAAEWLASTTAVSFVEPPVRDWPVFMGSARRVASRAGSAPLLKPQWTVPLFGVHAETIQELIAPWEDQLHLGGYPVTTANSPLVVAGMVIFRDAEGIRALGLESGRLLWHHRCETSLAAALPGLTDPDDSDADAFDLSRVFHGNTVLGTLASDGQRLYAIDSVDFGEADDTRRGRRRNRGSPRPSSRAARETGSSRST